MGACSLLFIATLLCVSRLLFFRNYIDLFQELKLLTQKGPRNCEKLGLMKRFIGCFLGAFWVLFGYFFRAFWSKFLLSGDAQRNQPERARCHFAGAPRFDCNGSRTKVSLRFLSQTLNCLMGSHYHQVAILVPDDKLDYFGQLENFFAWSKMI